MNKPLKILTFGIVGGLVWSAVPSFLVWWLGAGFAAATGGFTAKAVSGVLTGVIISFALGVPLKKFGKRATILLGVLALPLGAFLYGFIFSIVEWTIHGGKLPAPLVAGFVCAVVSVVSSLAIVLFALAILTTFLLGRVIAPIKPGDAV